MVHNNHPYKLDSEAQNTLRVIREKYLNKPEIALDEVKQLQVSNKFHIREPLLNDDTEIQFINDLDECVQHVVQTKVSKIGLLPTIV